MKSVLNVGPLTVTKTVIARNAQNDVRWTITIEIQRGRSRWLKSGRKSTEIKHENLVEKAGEPTGLRVSTKKPKQPCLS